MSTLQTLPVANPLFCRIHSHNNDKPPFVIACPETEPRKVLPCVNRQNSRASSASDNKALDQHDVTNQHKETNLSLPCTSISSGKLLE